AGALTLRGGLEMFYLVVRRGQSHLDAQEVRAIGALVYELPLSSVLALAGGLGVTGGFHRGVLQGHTAVHPDVVLVLPIELTIKAHLKVLLQWGLRTHSVTYDT